MSNETIRVIFERDGVQLPVDYASRGDDRDPGGISFAGEVAAWPRRTMVTLEPVNTATQAKVDQVVTRMGRFQLDVDENNGHVILTGERENGIPNRNLPSGFWNFTLNVYPFGNFRRKNIHLEKDSELVFRVPLDREPGSIDVQPEAAWDAEIRRVLAASELDMHPVETWRPESGVEWCLNPERWARRRACAMNVLAVSRELNLIHKIRRVFLAEVDRTYTQVDPDFETLLDGARFNFEGPPGHRIHRRILDTFEVPEDEIVSKWQLTSFRHKRNPSLQVVVARETQPAGSDPATFAELDIDRGNPMVDLFGFFTHLGEVAHPGRTNHIRLHETLAQTTAAPFLAYSPISA